MTGYNITLSDGDPLTTINVKTIDDRGHSSLTLIGQGIPNYGTAIAQDFVWLMENFSSPISPVHPLIGQEWYDSLNKRMNVYDGTAWHYYTATGSTNSTLFDMAVASQNIDFTVAATTAIFTGTDAAKKYCPVRVVMIPRGSFTATTAATINLSVTTAGDVLSSISIPITANTKFVKLDMNTQPAFVAGTGTLNLNITTAATGGLLKYDVYVFGFIL